MYVQVEHEGTKKRVALVVVAFFGDCFFDAIWHLLVANTKSSN